MLAPTHACRYRLQKNKILSSSQARSSPKSLRVVDNVGRARWGMLLCWYLPVLVERPGHEGSTGASSMQLSASIRSRSI
jgi:hypothetical protein